MLSRRQEKTAEMENKIMECSGFFPGKTSKVMCRNCSRSKHSHDFVFILPMLEDKPPSQQKSDLVRCKPPPRPKNQPNFHCKGSADSIFVNQHESVEEKRVMVVQTTLDPESSITEQTTLDPESSITKQTILDLKFSITEQMTLATVSSITEQTTLNPESSIKEQTATDVFKLGSNSNLKSQAKPHSQVIPDSRINPDCQTKLGGQATPDSGTKSYTQTESSSQTKQHGQTVPDSRPIQANRESNNKPVSRRRALSPAPERPSRSSTHKARHLAYKRNTRNISNCSNANEHLESVKSEKVIDRPNTPNPIRGRIKRRAPTPVRTFKAKSDAVNTGDGSQVELNTPAANSCSSPEHLCKGNVDTRNMQAASEIEQILKRKLAALNAQLHCINHKVHTDSAITSTENPSQTIARITAAEIPGKLESDSASSNNAQGVECLLISPHSEEEMDDDPALPDNNKKVVSEVPSNYLEEMPNSIEPTFHHRVTFCTDEVIIINDVIGDLYCDLDSNSSEDTESFGISNSDAESEDKEKLARDVCLEETTDRLHHVPLSAESDEEKMAIDINIDSGDNMNGPFSSPHSLRSRSRSLSPDKALSRNISPSIYEVVVNTKPTTKKPFKAGIIRGQPDACSTAEQECSRTSRSRERKQKDPAPNPPDIKAPALKSIALRMDSRGYVAAARQSNRTPHAGKSKQDVSAPEFVAQIPSPDTPEPEEQSIEDDDEELCVEGKLPKEFLDTWVSSTTHQLMDEMDLALKGVWPYDKKEDTSNYHRKSSSNENLTERMDDNMTTLKKRSKQKQIPSSGWSDRGSIGASSNFILKEKTKKSPAGSNNSGSLLNLNQFSKPQSGGRSQTLQRQSHISPSHSRERRHSRDLGLTELDGSLPKTKFREQFLHKLQKEGQLSSDRNTDPRNADLRNADLRNTSQADPIGDGATLKKKNRSSETPTTASSSRGHNFQSDSKHQVNSILKNAGSNSSTPDGTISKSKKTPPVGSHGRQSSVPNSTYSGSSSGQSGDFRSKEQLPEGKISPSTSNPHDSGYESGTVRSRKEAISEFNHQHNGGYEGSSTMRPRKELQTLSTHSRDSSYEASTMRFKQGAVLSSAEYSTLKRVKRSPTLSLRSAQRGSSGGTSSAISSIPLCFDQLTAMNVSTLQHLCASYIQIQKQLALAQEEKPMMSARWHDIGLIDELEPMLSTAKLVLYKGYMRQNPQETFTVMLSLREPVKFDMFKPNLMKTSVTFEAKVPPHLIPASLYVGKKLMKNHTSPAPKEATTPAKEVVAKSLAAPYVRNLSTPTFHTQQSADKNVSIKNGQISRLESREELKIESRLKSEESSTPSFTVHENNRDSGFINQRGTEVVAKSLAAPYVRNLSTPTFHTQQSADKNVSIKNGQISRLESREELKIESRLKSEESSTPSFTVHENNRDSGFINQRGTDASVASVVSLQEQAAVDCILMAVAGEEEPELPEELAIAIPAKQMEPELSEELAIAIPTKKLESELSEELAIAIPAKKEEPVKLASRIEAFASPIKKPVVGRYTSTRTLDLTNNNSSNRKPNSFDKLIPGLKTSGLVRNRIANLNLSNNNNVDEEEEFDMEALNSNNNNNLDDLLSSSSCHSGGDFIFANHLLEMAGEDLPAQAADSESDSSATLIPRGAEGLTRCQDKVSAAQNVTCYVTILPTLPRVESIKTYLERLRSESRSSSDLEMDVIFVLLQVLNIVFGLHESQLRLDSISTSDFLVVTDSANISTVHCHMINVTQAPNQKIGLTCEKLRMFLMQISHSTSCLQKSVIFTTVDDLIQNAEDLGDLRTILAILQYLLWGPKEDEVKVITLAEHRRQAFELWLQLARGKLVSSLAIKSIDNLKTHMVTSFLANTNGSELFKITKLLNTY